jgi:ADP-ribose pyrophosphatase YjhB (NUDIX family)
VPGSLISFALFAPWRFTTKDNMPETNPPRWLAWAREIQALSQTGLTFTTSEYEIQRYQRLTEIAAEIIHNHTGLPQEPLLENMLMQPGYATPKVDVRGAVVRDGRILLVQERVDERWTMPGGWADVGDLPSETVVREVWEESGFDVVPRKVVGVFDANRSGRPLELYHAYKIVFLCEITGGQARPSNETLAVDFFRFGDLPPLSINRTHERHLAEVRAHLQDPNRPAAFD